MQKNLMTLLLFILISVLVGCSTPSIIASIPPDCLDANEMENQRDPNAPSPWADSPFSPPIVAPKACESEGH